MPEKRLFAGLRFWPMLLLGVLSGCSPLTLQQNIDGPVPVTLRVDDAAYWLEEWQRALQLPAEQYAETLAARQREFERQPGPRSRLRLALLLAEGQAAGKDLPRALQLVEHLEQDKASGSARALALLLKNDIKKQLGRKKVDGSQQRDLEKELKAARSRIKELERQLHELTSIEQNIQDRTKR